MSKLSIFQKKNFSEGSTIGFPDIQKTYIDGAETHSPEDNSSSDTSWWQSIITALPDWLNGAANLTQQIKGNPDTYIVENKTNNSNTGLYIALGAVVLIVILVIVLKKN
ncbi:MAG: hypothetical protein LBU51_01110 [Bacteroidales bacterium]|jgi:hypothetical protein|nr:hypothetical protein [Bacteroidales bacterium]